MNQTASSSAVGVSSLVTAAGTWRFPHSTCEAMHLDGPVLQPYSAFTNVVTTAFLVAFIVFPQQCSGWTVAKKDRMANSGKYQVSIVARLSLLPMVLFEAFHAFCHTAHWEKGSVRLGAHNAQEVIIHVLGAWGMAAGVFACCYHKHGQTKYQNWIIAAWIVDAINWFGFGGSLIAVFGMNIGISVFMSYYPAVGPLLRERVLFFSINAFLLGLQIVHESIGCQFWVTQISPHPPYHMIVELYGLYLFLYLADTMYLLDTQQYCDPQPKLAGKAKTN